MRLRPSPASRRRPRTPPTAAQVVGRVRALGKQQGWTLAPTPLGPVIDGALSLLEPQSRTSGVTVQRALPPGLPPVLGDAVMLRQVMVNLCRNAMEAMATSPRRQLTIDARAETEGGRTGRQVVTVTVADTGPGMSAEANARAGEAFYTTKRTGTRLHAPYGRAGAGYFLGRDEDFAMPLLGAHMSIAGGYYKAADAAAALGMDTVQIFTKNNNQWAAKPLTEEATERFREAVAAHGLRKNCSHASYLINLASPDAELRAKSADALTVEVERAEALGLAGVVLHPGAFLKSSEDEGLVRVAEGLDLVHGRTEGVMAEVWLEATAGQGTCLGHRFEHLGAIRSAVADAARVGVCVDTCHIFAAGYALESEADYEATIADLARHVGLQHVRAWHLNDSKKPLGSRVDRHDHIGEGHMGLEPFRRVTNDPRFADLPMFLETKKETRDGREMDAVNLETLRKMTAG